MAAPLSRKITLTDLRNARRDGTKIPMLTCYDYTTARLMQAAGVPALLVGDSAANVVLGHPTTVPVSLSLMIELTAAVRRGAPLSFLIGDMPFGSYGGSVGRGVRNVCRMLKLSGCDCVKLEVSGGHVPLVKALAEVGVAVMAHLGLRPQSVGLLGGYRYQGRTAAEAAEIVSLAVKMQGAGAAAVLLEAVPGEVGEAVVAATDVPVIGCGAGPACHGSVVVTPDLLGMTPSRPRFVQCSDEFGQKLTDAFATYAAGVRDGTYPAPEHAYPMDAGERAKLRNMERPRPSDAV